MESVTPPMVFPPVVYAALDYAKHSAQRRRDEKRKEDGKFVISEWANRVVKQLAPPIEESQIDSLYLERELRSVLAILILGSKFSEHGIHQNTLYKYTPTCSKEGETRTDALNIHKDRSNAESAGEAIVTMALILNTRPGFIVSETESNGDSSYAVVLDHPLCPFRGLLDVFRIAPDVYDVVLAEYFVKMLQQLDDQPEPVFIEAVTTILDDTARAIRSIFASNYGSDAEANYKDPTTGNDMSKHYIVPLWDALLNLGTLRFFCKDRRADELAYYWGLLSSIPGWKDRVPTDGFIGLFTKHSIGMSYSTLWGQTYDVMLASDEITEDLVFAHLDVLDICVSLMDLDSAKRADRIFQSDWVEDAPGDEGPANRVWRTVNTCRMIASTFSGEGFIDISQLQMRLELDMLVEGGLEMARELPQTTSVIHAIANLDLLGLANYNTLLLMQHTPEEEEVWRENFYVLYDECEAILKAHDPKRLAELSMQRALYPQPMQTVKDAISIYEQARKLVQTLHGDISVLSRRLTQNYGNMVETWCEDMSMAYLYFKKAHLIARLVHGDEHPITTKATGSVLAEPIYRQLDNAWKKGLAGTLKYNFEAQIGLLNIAIKYREGVLRQGFSLEGDCLGG